MLKSQPIQLTQRNDRCRRHSRASIGKWEAEDSAFSYKEAERLEGWSRDPGWEDRAAQESGRARN